MYKYKAILVHSEKEHLSLLLLIGTLEDGPLAWTDDVTEVVVQYAHEQWEIYNLSPDGHSIHVHQSDMQILSRWVLTVEDDEVIDMTEEALWAADSGLHDAVVIEPNHMAAIYLQFNITGMFTWHCHMLSHEDNDMMRPIEVVVA